MKLTEEEKELLEYAGKEVFKFLVTLYKKSREQGIDLEKILSVAADKNSKTIFDV